MMGLNKRLLLKKKGSQLLCKEFLSRSWLTLLTLRVTGAACPVVGLPRARRKHTA